MKALCVFGLLASQERFREMVSHLQISGWLDHREEEKSMLIQEGM